MNRRMALLEILHRQEIVIASLVIHPIIWGNHGVGVERGNDVVHHFFLRETQLAGVDPVNVQPQAGIIQILRDVDLAHSRQLPDAAAEILRQAIDLMQVSPADLDIDGRRHAAVQDRVHHRAAGEERADVGILRRHLLLHAIHVFEAAQAMRLVQRDLNRGRVGSRVAGVERREVRDDSDVGDHHLEVFLAHHLPDQVLHLRDILLGQFNTGPSRNLQIDRELASVSARKKRQAHRTDRAPSSRQTRRSESQP